MVKYGKPKGLHWDKEKLWCNKCNRYVDKYTGTIQYHMPIKDNPDNYDLFCLICNNWLCGVKDAFPPNNVGGW